MRGQRKVDVFTHRKSGLEIEVSLRIADSTFLASAGNQDFEDANLVGLKDKITRYLDELYAVTLQPVIEVKPGFGYGAWGESDVTATHTAVELEIHRFWWARDAAGHLYREEWADHDRGWNSIRPWRELNRTRFSDPPCVMEDRHDPVYYFPYTEALWNGLQGMVTAISTLQDRLRDLLKQPTWIERVGSQYLLEGPDGH